MTQPITFENGMMVKLRGLRDKYGEGAYEVVNVQLVDQSCTCGAAQFYSGGYEEICVHFEGCRALSARSVGHHQIVTVQTPKGEVQLSGAWFVPA